MSIIDHVDFDHPDVIPVEAEMQLCEGSSVTAEAVNFVSLFNRSAHRNYLYRPPG
jgi:hypothetical protein